MRRRIAFLTILATAVLAGCGDKESLVPADRVVAAGSYTYSGSYLHPVSQEWELLGGTLVLETATPDSIHGHWVLTGFVPDSTGGYWNENAFVFPALSDDNIVTITHRIWRIGTPSEVRCTLTYREVQPDTDPITTNGTCELTPR